MKFGRGMELMSQIETHLDDSFAANEEGLDERFLFALQSAQFSPIVAKPIARPASCSFVPAGRGFREPWEFCCETVCAVQPLERGL
jgi:hypothetical protein